MATRCQGKGAFARARAPRAREARADTGERAGKRRDRRVWYAPMRLSEHQHVPSGDAEAVAPLVLE
jgi:hypothetical protein